MKTKEDEGYKDKPDEKPKDEGKTPESRLEQLEDNVKKINSDISKILKAVTKEDDEDDKDKKKEDDDKMDDEYKDKKKVTKEEITDNGNSGVGTEDVNPAPKGGDAKLPDSPAGETDETAAPAGEKPAAKLEKEDIQKMIDAGVKNKMDEMGITKTTTPRSRHEPQDNLEKSSAKQKDFGLDLLKRAKEGTLSMADMNRETKAHIKQSYDKKMEAIMGIVGGQ